MLADELEEVMPGRKVDPGEMTELALGDRDLGGYWYIVPMTRASRWWNDQTGVAKTQEEITAVANQRQRQQ